MFSSFRRLLKRSKDREIPQANQTVSYTEGNVNEKLDGNAACAYIALKLLHRPRPGLASEISRLRWQHRELQRRFKQLSPGKPHVRQAKLIAALNKMTDGSRSTAQPGKNLGRPLTSIDPSWLAARSAHRIKATKIPSYRGNSSLNAKNIQKSASLEAETCLDIWHTKGRGVLPKAAPAALTTELNEKAAEDPFNSKCKHAANAHRMRRLREWSLTHGQDVAGAAAEGGEQDFAEASLARIQQQGTNTNTDSATTSTTKNTNFTSSRGVTSLKAWNIMAGLSLETLGKKRGAATAATMEINAAAGLNAASLGAHIAFKDDREDRRKTEPLNISQQVGRKSSDGEQKETRQQPERWNRGSLVGRPRNKRGIQ